MRRHAFPYVLTGALVVAANLWLMHVLSGWKILPGDGSSPPPWQSALNWALTWLATLPQIPSLILGKQIADAFGLSEVGWAITVSALSVAIYFPLIYLWTHRRRRPSPDDFP
jgi:hypothetical protein